MARSKLALASSRSAIFRCNLCTSAACTASIFLAALVTVRDDWMVLGAGDESWSIEREEDRGLAEGGVEAPPLLPPSLGRLPRRLMGDRFGVNSDVPVSAAIADVRGGTIGEFRRCETTPNSRKS